MKTYVEIGLAALLAVLVYEKPEFLVNTANTTLGKVALIVIVGLLAKQYGINAGILAAIIVILLQDSNREGLTCRKADDVLVGTGGKCATSQDCGAIICDVVPKKVDLAGNTITCTGPSSCVGKVCVGKCQDVLKEPFDLQPASFPVTGTDQIGLSRMLKVNAINATVAASQQANGCTNNGGGIAF